jgi:putative signal transducing protein
VTARWFEGDGDPGVPDGRVTVARFSSPVEAQIARGMLESAGIECFLIGENVNNLLQSAFRVRVQVSADDEDAALQLLGSIEDLPEPGDPARS